ncbi:MAG: hypothetical protein IPJ98_15235 [Bryobacterales bacterium]|nr:hypothetical protein [Bryobacterales bacterium]
MASSETTAAPACQRCRILLDARFDIIDGQPACDDCAPGLREELRRRQAESLSLPGGWWTRAALFGSGAALAGALVYALIFIGTGLEPTPLALAIGALCGIAARAGAGNKGGLPLQFLAVGLTYFGMFSAYALVALFTNGAQHEGQPRDLFYAITQPFVAGPIGLICLVVGFFLAWRFCAEGKAGESAQQLWQRLADSSRD